MKIEGTDVETKIMPLYLEGKSIQEIADIFCIKNTKKLVDTIEEYLSTYDKKFKYVLIRVENISNKELYKLYSVGYSYIEIANQYNISKQTVEKKINKYCSEKNITIKRKTNQVELLREELIKKDTELQTIANDFKNGMTLAQLARKYHYATSTVRNKISCVISDEEFKKITRRNQSKNFFTYDKINEIIELYETGKYSKERIAQIVNITNIQINKVLKEEYQKRGFSDIPIVVKKSVFDELMHFHKFTKQELLEYAKNANKIIPQQFIKEYFKEEIDIDKIRKFVITQYTESSYNNANKQKEMFKSFNIAKLLKEKEYDTKYQTVAILYSLPKNLGVSMEEIRSAVKDDEEIISSIELLNSDNLDYLQDKKNQMAINVKIAEILEEIKQANINEIPLDLNSYKTYINLSRETKLDDDFYKAMLDNKRLKDIDEIEQ